MAYGDRLRLLMVLGKVAIASLSSPPTKLSGAKHVLTSRLPNTVVATSRSAIGPLQSRIPSIISARRPPFVLRAQLALPIYMQLPGQQPPQGVKQVRRKRKHMTPEVEARLTIQLAARESDFHSAFEAFDAAMASGLQLSPDAYVTLMFLASGGDDWESLVDKQQAGEENALGNLGEFLGRCEEVIESMKAAGHKTQEMCCTALARRDALLKNPAGALEHALSVHKEGHNSRLRCFAPALAAYAVRGDCEDAFTVYKAIEAAGLEPTESEFRRLLQAAASAPQAFAWDRIESLLDRISKELTTLEPETIAQVRALFASPTAGGLQKWEVVECQISTEGVCAACGSKLQALDLNDQEYEEFKTGVADLAARQERHPNNFKSASFIITPSAAHSSVFVEWLDANGPFGAIVDAANVAFFGQNFESGRFSFPQIGAVVDRLREVHPDLRPLVILHTNRTKAPPAQAPDAQTLLTDLEDAGCFYAAPHGSNDDWYWMYAAVACGPSGLLISNDEMRDHIFHMLTPKFFNKWKQRHQTRYKFAGLPDTLTLEYPPPFTTCVQRLSCGSWVFPCVDGTWVCAKPVSSTQQEKAQDAS